MAAAGFLLASKWDTSFGLFAATIFGISLVIASACTANNYLDRDIDRKMARTKKRALASGAISGQVALAYAGVLGVAGFTILLTWTNFLAAAIAWIGYVVYVLAYGFAKRNTVYSTIIGSVPGAVPPVVGYTAFTDRFDTGAAILFLILVLWQMPHFYAIAIYRYDDYKAAGLPVLPVAKGFRTAKLNILFYVVGFCLAISALTAFAYSGYVYLALALGLGLSWLWRAWMGFKTRDDKRWARGFFVHSLIVISILSILIALGSVLP